MTPSDLDTADILAACMNYVPVNARVDQAIAAHRIAFKSFEGDPDDPVGRQLAMYTLHAVVLARTPEPNDYRVQLDYLTALPVNAWPDNPGWTAEAIREATLAGITRCLGWMMVGSARLIPSAYFSLVAGFVSHTTRSIRAVAVACSSGFFVLPLRYRLLGA